MNEKYDPRMGLPSGSSALECSLCQGRFQAEKLWATITEGQPGDAEDENQSEGPSDDMDKDAAAGTRIHRLYAGEVVPEASEAEHRRAEQALQIDTRIHETWANFFRADPEEQIVITRERRWWMTDDSGHPIYSGQTDLLKIRGHINGQADILIGDLKGLWGYHDDATLNLQIRHYIGLVAFGIKSLGYIGVRSAACYLNQPAKTLSPKLAMFDADDVERTVQEVFLHAMAINDPDASRTAGPIQCHRCRAKLICEEFGNMAMDLPVPILTPAARDQIPTKVAIEQSIVRLTGEKLAELLPWLPALESTVALAKSEAKRRLRLNIASVPGWKLKPNSPRTKVIKLLDVYNRLANLYKVDATDFLGHCSITGENLEGIARKASGLKGKALAERLKEIKDGCTQETKVSDSLEEIK